MRRTIILALAALAACSDGSSVDLASLSTSEVTARCEWFTRCGLAASVDQCVAYFRKPPPERFTAAKTAGKLDYDGGQGQKCLDAISAQSCDTTAEDARVLPEACARMFHGKVAEGGDCDLDEECGSGACDKGVCPDGTCCEGMCAADHRGAKVGEACATTADCVDSYCDVADHSCHALVAAAGQCSSDFQCDYGLACVSASPSLPGACTALPRIGEACPNQRCAELGALCDATFHCVALALPGGTCSSNADCSSLAECDTASHQCVNHPTLGMPCSSVCARESWCKFDAQGNGTCIAPLANGTACEDSYNCQSQNCRPGPIFDSCEDPTCP